MPVGERGSEFGLATMQRVLRRSGGERIADDAAKELSKALEEISYKISKQAIDFAAHAGRETIKAEDIRLAAKYVVKQE
jgi:DNA-binding protein